MPVDLLRLWRGPVGGSAYERVWRVIPTAIYMGLIFFSSSLSGPDVPQVVDDRVAHFVVYFGLGVVTMLSVAGFARVGVTATHAWIAVMLIAIYALSDEWHQSFVPGRDSSFKDLTFDMLGSGSAVLLILALVGGRR